MLQINQISLLQFRNYVQQQFVFTEKVVGICGLNGSGKTNLLDAIYYLGFTKSYFNKSDNQNAHHGLQGMRLQGDFLLQNEILNVTCIIRENNKKEFSVNGTEYKKMSEHIGKFSCVMIAPDDVELIIGGSEERRKFIDTILSQIDRNYLLNLIDYQKILQQRNSVLKQAAETGKMDDSLLEILNHQLAIKGDWIFIQRKAFLIPFLEITKDFYQKIARKSDAIALEYESDLMEFNTTTLLEKNLAKDKIVQRTTAGIHKDDIVFKMADRNFKNEASQGQRKSLLFALKLAEWQTLKQEKGFPPILLLDDVFEKLDEQRMHNLLKWVCESEDGQVFITDTHAQRLQQQLHAIPIQHQLICI
ncbi:MAG: DNA replication/repair protein RecF [Chitinophagaceae bacterium]